MENLLSMVQAVNAAMSDYILIFLLIGTGLYFSFKTKFVQVRCFGEGIKRVFGTFSLNGGKQHGGISSFQALTTAIAAQVGTGNIVGACGAILVGGPGAIFWMWIIAFFGMSTAYAEAVLAQKTRVVKEDGSVGGGPAFYIPKAFKGSLGKVLSALFSIAIILALGFCGSMVQSNSMAEAVNNAFGIPTWIMGIAICVVASLIFVGGLDRIASVTEKIVPIMAALYLLGGLILLIFRIEYVPATFGMIFKYAFAPQAIIGGSVGEAIKIAISQGVKRGLFSNEAGMGSSPHAHAMAKVDRPHDQGVVAMIGVFLDTFIVLTMTALICISTLYTPDGILAHGAVGIDAVQKTNMTQMAFASVFGDSIGNAFVAICLLFFAFSTIISWNFFGKINAEHLWGKTGVKIYTVISLVFLFLGSCLSNDLVWELADFFNQIMVLPNVLALVALGKIVSDEALSRKERLK